MIISLVLSVLHISLGWNDYISTTVPVSVSSRLRNIFMQCIKLIGEGNIFYNNNDENYI